jgi:hypothetical protein
VNTSRHEVVLYVGEHDGKMWATNRYWVVPAERVAPLLEDANLSAAEPGAYEVNGRVRPADMQVPDFGSILHPLEEFTVTGERITIAGQLVYALDGYDNPMALFRLPSGSTVGLRADELVWLSDLTVVTLPGKHKFAAGSPRLVFRRGEAGGNYKAAIVADVLHVTQPHEMWHGPGAGERREVPEVTEPAGTKLLALMAALKYTAESHCRYCGAEVEQGEYGYWETGDEGTDARRYCADGPARLHRAGNIR